MKIGFVVLNYINYTDTIRCIDSIIKCVSEDLSPQKDQFIIMIIDNDSPNSSFEKLEKHVRKKHVTDRIQIQLKKTEQNIGYGGGNNIGLNMLFGRHCCNYVFLINNDAILLNFRLKELIGEIHRQNCDVIGAQIFEETMNEKPMNGGAIFHKLFFLSRGLRDISKLKKSKRTMFYLSGAFMGISKSAYSMVGALEESYFLYFEELDWMCRAEKTFNRELRIHIATEIKILHKVGGSTGNTKTKKVKGRIAEYYSARSRILFARKILPTYTINAIAYNILLLLYRLISGHWKNSLIIISATYDGLTGVHGTQDRMHID